ncbi:hypothetical protein G4B88_023413 [Cannabis sativa]|uniref:Disease resistance N-terminal domain-containing protein n=1 Tax=Cannabis sativa TaxID=3483 RepID=A0A7J6DJ49_CANSA|nr:hypothetical protein G4B88_023413 [Cannabis sativa]
MAAELVIGGLVSASLNQVFDQLVTMASGMVDLFTGKDEAFLRLMEELKVKMSTADLLLIEAEKKLITDHKVRQWIDDLKNNIYNADDLVYKIQTEALRNELENSEFYGSSSSVAIPTKPLFFTSLETLIIENLEKLEEWSFTEGGAFPRCDCGLLF